MLRNGEGCGAAVRRTLSLSGSMEAIAYLNGLNLNLLKPPVELWHQILALIKVGTWEGYCLIHPGWSILYILIL